MKGRLKTVRMPMRLIDMNNLERHLAAAILGVSVAAGIAATSLAGDVDLPELRGRCFS